MGYAGGFINRAAPIHLNRGCLMFGRYAEGTYLSFFEIHAEAYRSRITAIVF